MYCLERENSGWRITRREIEQHIPIATFLLDTRSMSIGGTFRVFALGWNRKDQIGLESERYFTLVESNVAKPIVFIISISSSVLPSNSEAKREIEWCWWSTSNSCSYDQRCVELVQSVCLRLCCRKLSAMVNETENDASLVGLIEEEDGRVHDLDRGRVDQLEQRMRLDRIRLCFPTSSISLAISRWSWSTVSSSSVRCTCCSTASIATTAVSI